MTKRRKASFMILVILMLIVAAIFYDIRYIRADILTISFLNVGQGDAIWIEAPNGRQVLLDGGPGRSVLSELGAVMPFYDKAIDMVIVSNPDRDHIEGLLDVLKRYKIAYAIEPGTFSETPTYAALLKAVEEEGAERIIFHKGMRIVLDEKRNIYIEALFPDRDVSEYSTNDGSLIAKLVYGNSSVMLQGDAPSKQEEYLLSIDPKILDADILKTGHHGSRTSTDLEYVKAVSPEYAIISSGKDNSYGHPHKEVLDALSSQNIFILRTDQLGRITFQSDGEKFFLKKSLAKKIFGK